MDGRADRKAYAFVNRDDGATQNVMTFDNRVKRLREKFDEIDADRRVASISRERLCARAGVPVRTWFRIANGALPRDATLARLRAALRMMRREASSRPVEDEGVLVLAYRGALGLVASAMGLDPVEAIRADPQANRPFDPLWRSQATARARALYVLNIEALVPMSLAGELAGVTKQAVSKVLRQIEDSRDDPTIDAMIERIAAAVRVGG